MRVFVDRPLGFAERDVAELGAVLKALGFELQLLPLPNNNRLMRPGKIMIVGWEI